MNKIIPDMQSKVLLFIVTATARDSFFCNCARFFQGREKQLIKLSWMTGRSLVLDLVRQSPQGYIPNIVSGDGHITRFGGVNRNDWHLGGLT